MTRPFYDTRWPAEILQDIRFAVRILAKSKALTAILILTLAIRIGANAAVFTLVNQILLHPPGFVSPDRVVAVRVDTKNLTNINASGAVLADVRSGHEMFAQAAALDFVSLNFVGSNGPIVLKGLAVSSEWFDVFRVQPRLGRVFSSEEDQPGANFEAVLPYATWVRFFGADATVIGRTIELSERSYRIVGVMPSGMGTPYPGDIYIPLALPPASFFPQRRCCGTLSVFARLQDGVLPSNIASWMKTQTERAWNEGTPESALLKNDRWRMYAVPLLDYMHSDFRTPLVLLLISVGLLFVIICLNLASLMLARISNRSQELVVRSAVGATKARLMRQLLTECALVSATGTLLGLALAPLCAKGLLLMAPSATNVGIANADIDPYMLAYSAVAGAISCALFALVPMFQTTRVTTSAGPLRTGTRTSAGSVPRRRLLSGLAIIETCLATVLLIVAGLLLKSFNALEMTDIGFKSHGLMSGTFALPASQYPEAQGQAQFYRMVLDRLGSTPSVTDAAVSIGMPFSGWVWAIGIDVEGRKRAPGEQLIQAARQLVTPGYFRTLKIPLRRGRFFTTDDRAGTERVCILDEKLAQMLWPNVDPIGERISVNGGRDWIRVVGVVGHTKYDLDNDLLGLGVVYFNLFQREGKNPLSLSWVVARGARDSAALAGAIRQSMLETDRYQPVDQLKSMDNLIADALATRRYVLHILEIFALTAVLLAGLGLYGLISYTIAERTRELGIRAAFGAAPRQIQVSVIFRGFNLAIIGLFLGFLVAFGAMRPIANQLRGVSPYDPVTYVLVALGLILVTLMACYIPARRASRINPVDALRWE